MSGHSSAMFGRPEWGRFELPRPKLAPRIETVTRIVAPRDSGAQTAQFWVSRDQSSPETPQNPACRTQKSQVLRRPKGPARRVSRSSGVRLGIRPGVSGTEERRGGGWQEMAV